MDGLVIGHDDRHWRIKLTKSAQDPVLPFLFVMALNAHGLEQLDGDADLALSMHAFIARSATKLA